MNPDPSQRPDPSVIDSDSQRRVVFCITELDPGGAELALVRVACGLKRLGWDVSVVSLRDAGDLAGRLEAGKVPVTALHCGSLADIRAIFRLRRILIQRRPDLLVCFLHQANLVGRIAGWMAATPAVISGIRVADRRRLVVWSDRLTRHLTDGYVAVSRHVADLHARLCRIPRDRMHVIRNGVEVPEKMTPRVERGNSRFRVLFVGRLVEQKRPQNLLRAVAALPSAIRAQFQVDLLGDGPLRRQLERQVHRSGLRETVRLHGNRTDVPSWMAESDVLVLPSAWEGLPNVVLEAMAAGLPVIASRVDGIPEVVEDGHTGWLVPADDIPALAERLVAVSGDFELRQRVSERAFESAQQRFCWSATVTAFDTLMSELLPGGSELEKHSSRTQ